MRFVSHPCRKRDELPHDRVDSFALRISALPHFCGKSPVCLPSTVYKAGSTTWASSDREFMLGPGTRSAVPSLTRDARSVAVDASGIAPYRLLRVPAFASRCPYLGTALAGLDNRPALTDATRRGAGAASVVVDADFRAAAEQRRAFSKAPISKKTWHGISSPGRCNVRRSAACKCVAPSRARRAGCCPRGLPGRVLTSLYGPLRRRLCVYFAHSSCQRNVQGCILHFGLYALDARDRLGP
jgi:hypothetical protein